MQWKIAKVWLKSLHIKREVNSPADAAALVQVEMSLPDQEVLKVMVLDSRNHVLEIVNLYQGSVNSSQIRVAEVFQPAIQRMAPAILVAHEHPSADPTRRQMMWPSPGQWSRQASF